MNKALFLDRDGVIIEDHYYVHKPDQVVFIDDAIELCKYAQAAGYKLIVVTNQAGVAKGYFSEADVLSLHNWMAIQLNKRGIIIDAFYYCPHHIKGSVAAYSIDCNCRKPRPGLIEQALRDFDIDLSESIMVGDKSSDRIDLPGLRSVILKSQYCKEGFDVERIAEIKDFL